MVSRIGFCAALALSVMSLNGALHAEEEAFDVVLLESGDSIIQTIKVVREATPGLGLKDAMDLVKGAPKTIKAHATKADGDKLLKAFDALHARAEMRDAAGKVVATTTVEPEVPGKFDLVLKAFPAENKMFVIKLVKDLSVLGLDESNKLVSTLPAMVKSGLDNKTAQKFKRLFEANKAEVEVKESAK